MAQNRLLTMRGWLAAGLAVALFVGGLVLTRSVQKAQAHRSELNALYSRVLNAQSQEEYDALGREIKAKLGQTRRPASP